MVGAPPRVHVHVTPTSGSWLNLVERLFAAEPHGGPMFREGDARLLDQRDKDPKPLVLTADADLIPGKAARLSKRVSGSGL